MEGLGRPDSISGCESSGKGWAKVESTLRYIAFLGLKLFQSTLGFSGALFTQPTTLTLLQTRAQYRLPKPKSSFFLVDINRVLYSREF